MMVTDAAHRGTNSYLLSGDGKFAIQSHSRFDSPTQTSIVTLPEHTVLRTLSDNAELRKRLAAIDDDVHHEVLTGT
jgi:dipeptidyl-peptidase-4